MRRVEEILILASLGGVIHIFSSVVIGLIK